MSRQTHRAARGGLIDRSAPLSFTFDGARYEGYRGDTLASALLANGVRLVGRSFKYHRPRGVFGAGAEEPQRPWCAWAKGRGSSRTSRRRRSSFTTSSSPTARTIGPRSISTPVR